MHESHTTRKALGIGRLAVFGLLLVPVSQILAQSIFVESGGQVVVEAEHFSSRTPVSPDTWLIVPTEDAGFP